MANPAPSVSARKRKPSPLLISVLIVGALVLLLGAAANFYTDILWFTQLGFESVLFTQWIATAVAFIAGFLGMFVPVFLSLEIAFRKRPVYAKISNQIAQYQQIVEPLRKVLRWLFPAFFGVIAGFNVAANWREILLFINSEPTGQTDAVFGLDTQFFMFQAPVIVSLISYLQLVVLVCLVASLAVSYVYGGIEITGRVFRISKSVRIQALILAAIWVLLTGLQHWMGQYLLLSDSSGRFTGPGFADANALIPGLQILAGIGVVVAILFIITASNGKWRVSVIGAALFVVSSLVLTTAVPWGVQQFRVGPDEKSLESEFIAHNIAATRKAFGLENVEVQRYEAVTNAEAGALRNDAVAAANIRIMDPAVVAPTFAQLEQSKQYYRFGNSLSVDRYEIDGRIEDTVSAPREIDISAQDGWYNRTLVYTHGYGLVAAFGNQRSPGGEPVFLENGIPTSGKLGEFEPRIYFGLNSPPYSIVGGEREHPIEVDFPADAESAAEASVAETAESNDVQADAAEEAQSADGERQNLTIFNGDGGPVLHGIFEKLIYALKFQSMELLLSEAVVDGSQILYNRNPMERVSAVAPYLTLDQHPYASVVDGRVVWIIDGYTTSANYPYSKQINLGSTLVDADNPNQRNNQTVNYIRNAVKATVDAYDGSVKLYAWDTEDPVLKAWQNIYPNTLTNMSEMSADLLSHVRYPNDLFKVQREVLSEYHVTDPGAFYSMEDAWRTPENPGRAAAAGAATEIDPATGEPVQGRAATPAQPPYYLTLSAGPDADPSFSIYSTYIPNQTGANARDILTGYLAADANAGTGQDGVVNENYGKLRLLVLPKGSTINGPGQVQNSFNTDPEVSRVLNILRQGETDVISGNLLTLPVGGGLLYVQPVYVQGKSRGFPLLQKVLVSFGDKIAFENTLDEALDKLFGGNSGVAAGDATVAAEATDPVADEADTDAGAGESGTTDAAGSSPTVEANSLAEALAEMQKALSDRDAAMKAGDWSAYGAADARLKAALEKALTLSE
ncbi:UPF0182 family protein [Canibacter zhoujuaniae]|uniref:UPF0182 family membrane protein n=1 Tax=Canibacter zhoujuaniae TaxID=2708343 RepID=UPI001AB04214|nr:UPF0182 family protein [Canibacter zhoujuaniae]